MTDGTKPRRTRVERGIYRQAEGNFAVSARRGGRLHFRTAGPTWPQPGATVRI
jgi:hypothetical protein